MMNYLDEKKNWKIISLAIPRPLQRLYTYKISPELESRIKIGGTVRVSFGKSIIDAFVVEFPKKTEELPSNVSFDDLKEVISIPNQEFSLNPDVLSLCQWAHRYYCISLGELLASAASSAGYPLNNKSMSKKKIEIKRIPDPQYLTPEQQEAVDFLDAKRKREPGKTALLQGVTGSGKTEVYIELAKRVLAEGNGVLILVPEIALTPQIYERFSQKLGVPIGLWHSSVSKKIRVTQANSLKKGEIKIVIGARSAIFAPICRLALIIVDEEHDSSYKQEERARFHARDLAIVRGKLLGGFVVLGSATPSFETLKKVSEKKYFVVNLKKKFFHTPESLSFEIIDLKSESIFQKIQTPLALKTVEKIHNTIANGNQVIIYLNKRGFATFLLCKDCGEIKRCPNCSLSLTVHKKLSQLRCHQCNHREVIPHLCLRCEGHSLSPVGVGTESIELELYKIIPNAKILRLDRDQITSVTKLNNVLDQFRNKEANILLGTHMLVKGHDFPEVTLVVIILADMLFHWPDFRASERAFQILKQVSGRAGRGEKKGTVLIQTYNPGHPVLEAITGKIPEENFIESEIHLRQDLGYPPFTRMARLRFEGVQQKKVIEESQSIFNALSLNSFKNLDILGPSEAFLEKVKKKYRWDLILKSTQSEVLHLAILIAKNHCTKQKLKFITDIDPYGL